MSGQKGHSGRDAGLGPDVGQNGHFSPKLPVSGRDTGLGPDQGQSHGLKGKSSQQMTPERKKGPQVTQTPICTLTTGGLGQKTPRRGVFDESQAFLGLGSATQGPASTTEHQKAIGEPKNSRDGAVLETETPNKAHLNPDWEPKGCHIHAVLVEAPVGDAQPGRNWESTGISEKIIADTVLSQEACLIRPNTGGTYYKHSSGQSSGGTQGDRKTAQKPRLKRTTMADLSVRYLPARVLMRQTPLLGLEKRVCQGHIG